MINVISKKPTELYSEGGTTEESSFFESGDSSLTL